MGIQAVSYTHLDVYKRQGVGRVYCADSIRQTGLLLERVGKVTCTARCLGGTWAADLLPG